jgi:adenylylsulfate kinase-like enzyme
MASCAPAAAYGLCSTSSQRRWLLDARFTPGEFIEIHVDATPAQAGGLAHPIGVGSDYEPPLAPELRLVTDAASVDALVEAVLAVL